MRIHVLLGMAMLSMTAPCAAGENPWAAETRELQRQLVVDPDDQVAMAQLARIYLKTDRREKARRLYRGLLSLENVALERKGGEPVWSHVLAARALKTLEAPVRLGSR